MSAVHPTLAERLARAPALQAASAALGDRLDTWVVGGALRDAALGREVGDVDLVVAEGPSGAAARIARAAGGPAFELSDRFATWRAITADRSWHIDVAGLRGDSIEADLALRDFTVNAIAVPLADAAAGGAAAALLDPHGGLADLEARLVRAVSSRSFEDDPLRILRAARIGAALGLDVEPGTVALARASAGRAAEPAGERLFAELRGFVAGPDPLRGLRVTDELGATAAVLPELEALRGVEQNPYHHLDVHGHTIEVVERLLEVERELDAYAGAAAGDVETLLAEPLADELTRGGALRFGALFHDVGKPETRSVGQGGRILFIGHDAAGARIVRATCERLRTSARLAAYLERICRNHLRLGFLVHERPLPRRRVYDYLLATEPDSVDITLLTVADRLATQGERTRPEAIDSHLGLARVMIEEALAWRRSGPPRAPIAGDELADALGIEPGPELGRLIGEIEAAVFAGEVSTRADAVALARRKLSG